MGRRLRWIDEAKEIKSWIEAMHSVNQLMQLVSTNTDVYKDGWKKYTPPVPTRRKTPIMKAVVTGLRKKTRTQFPTAQTTHVVFPEKKPQLDSNRQLGSVKIKPPRVELVENAMDTDVQVENAMDTDEQRDLAKGNFPRTPTSQNISSLPLRVKTEVAERDRIGTLKKWDAKLWRARLRRKLTSDSQGVMDYEDYDTEGYNKPMQGLARGLGFNRNMTYPKDLKEFLRTEFEEFFVEYFKSTSEQS